MVDNGECMKMNIIPGGESLFHLCRMVDKNRSLLNHWHKMVMSHQIRSHMFTSSLSPGYVDKQLDLDRNIANLVAVWCWNDMMHHDAQSFINFWCALLEGYCSSACRYDWPQQPFQHGKKCKGLPTILTRSHCSNWYCTIRPRSCRSFRQNRMMIITPNHATRWWYNT